MSAASTNELQDLYRDLILDHARSPRNFGRLENATHTAEGINPLCGDKLRLYLAIDEGGNVVESRFEGTGCAISVASASLLTETITNLSAAGADEWFVKITERLTGKVSVDGSLPSINDLNKLHALDSVRNYPSRVKCATLAWHALHAALSGTITSATTE